MNDIKISILLATYNGKKYIESCINSIISQTHSNWELLIGFNGTNDGTQKFIKEKFSDKRIKAFDYGQDKGKSKTLNKLIKETESDWIAIQDDDDIWLPRKLEKQIKYISDFDIIGTYIAYIDEFENIVGQPNLKHTNQDIISNTMRGDNQMANSSVFLKKSKLLEVGMWDENLTCLEDFDLWIKLIKNDCKFINVDTVRVLHRIHSNSNFNTISCQEQEKIKKEILKKYNYAN